MGEGKNFSVQVPDGRMDGRKVEWWSVSSVIREIDRLARSLACFEILSPRLIETTHLLYILFLDGQTDSLMSICLSKGAASSLQGVDYMIQMGGGHFFQSNSNLVGLDDAIRGCR